MSLKFNENNILGEKAMDLKSNLLSFTKNALKSKSRSGLDIGGEKLNEINRAIKERLLLLGEEYTDANGLKADWAHFDLMIAHKGNTYTSDVTRMVLLKMFWADLWLYLDPFTKSYEQLSADWQATSQEMDEMLQNHAELRLTEDLYMRYVKKEMTNAERMKFNTWNKKERKIIDDKIAKIQEDEQKAIEAKAKK